MPEHARKPIVPLPFADAWQQLRNRIDTCVGDADPAPWHMPHEDVVFVGTDGNNADFVRYRKLAVRTTLTALRALLLGNLTGWWDTRDGIVPVPAWAWEFAKHQQNLARDGRLILDVRLPDEWRRQSGLPIVLDQDAFEVWLNSDSWQAADQLPELPQPEERPLLLAHRAPAQQPFIGLAEAISWIAFGHALPHDDLWRGLTMQAFGPDEEANGRIGEAARRLAGLAAGGTITIRGLRAGGDTTVSYPPELLHDFAAYDVSRNTLCRGSGYLDAGDPTEEALTRVVVDRRQLLVAVPVPTPSETQVRTTIAAEDRCRLWLPKAFAEDDQHLRTKEDFRNEALERFVGLSDNGFGRVWSEHARDAGRSAAGRKRRPAADVKQ